MGKNALLLIISTLVASAIGEAAVRWMLPEWAPAAARATNFWQYDSRYGWAHVPDSQGSFSSFGFNTTVSINSKGFRGPSYPYERTNDSVRIVLLGDSFAWGFGVDYHNTFAATLEKDFPGANVINLAVAGYSTDQELLVYLDEGRKYDPDIVLIVVAANDIKYNSETLAYWIYGKPAFRERGGRLELINQPVTRTPWVIRAAHKTLWRSFIVNQLERTLRADRHLRPQVAPFRDDRNRITARLLMELRDQVSVDGADLLVVFIEDMIDGPAFASFLRQNNVESILLGDFISPQDKALYLYDGRHWNVAGHAIVAHALADALRERIGTLNGISLSRGPPPAPRLSPRPRRAAPMRAAGRFRPS